MIALSEVASERFADATGDELIEAGVGLIARGAFRARQGKGPEEARNLLSSALSTIMGMSHDMLRLHLKEQQKSVTS